MRRTFENYIIYLKEDLKLSNTCKIIKDNLLQSITNKTYFSEELISYFNRDNPNTPFTIDSTDPTQVAALKKIINALGHAEEAFKAIETTKINRDRYTTSILSETARVSYKAINELYSAFQLLNHSSSDIQNIVGSHVQKLIPKIALASKALEKFTPEHPEESAGVILGELVGILPTQLITETECLGNVSRLIYDLPHYFEQLQKLIDTGASGIATKSITSAEAYQAAMINNAKKIQKDIEKLSAHGGLFPYLSILAKLLKHSADLVDTAAPLTKQAYLDAVAQLKEIKHNLLPELIIELETIEESMGLKPGLLTQPTLEQMDAYYTQLADQVNSIASAAGFLDYTSDILDSRLGKFVRMICGDHKELDVGDKLSPVANLNDLMDDQFKEKRRALQVNRLNEARVNANLHILEEDLNALTAANRFFDKINSYNSFRHALVYKWSLANLNQSEKDLLIADYKKFQPHFAAHYPDIDRLIVEALTKPVGANQVSRLWSSEYKQLWGKDHFKTVINCKKEVIANINQDIAQAKFQIKLIKKTIQQAEEGYTEMYNKKEAKRFHETIEACANDPKLQLPSGPRPFRTALTTTVTPFNPSPFALEDNKPAAYYHQKGIDVSNQITELKQARAGVIEFFNYLREKYTHVNPSFASLDPEDKEFLRSAYKKFQSQFIAMKTEYGEINTQLVSNLTSEKTPSLHLEDLASLKTEIIESLNQLIHDLKQDRIAYFDKESDVRKQEETKEPLIPRGVEFEKKTLFGHLKGLGLSKSVDNFLNEQLSKHLKNNLSRIVWRELSTDGELIDFKKLPYLEFHKDTPKVVMYKQLINALYHIKIGFQQLESLHDLGDPSSIIKRGYFVKTAFNALVLNILTSRRYIMQAEENPALKEIIHEVLDLLEPIKDMPVIGNYLKPGETPEIKQLDIISEWHKQQRLVKLALSSISTPILDESQENTLEVKPEAPKKEAINYLQLMASHLYKIPVELKKLKDISAPEPNKQEIEAKIKTFIDGLSGLSFGPGTVQKILKATSRLQIQLVDIGKSGRELTMSHLKEIKAEFGTILMEAADSVEFNLGLKPGAYSSIVSNRFDNFYSNLITHLPIENDQTSLELLIDVTSTQKRLAREFERLKTINENSEAANAKINIFGSSDENQQFCPLYPHYVQLNEINKQIKDLVFVTQFGDSLDDLLNKADRIFQKIQPSLAEINPEFTSDFITKSTSDLMLTNAIDKLFAERPKPNPSSAFDKLRNLYLESNFSSTEDKEKFLQYYASLQPYLNKVNSCYNIEPYLRELQTPEDFTSAAQKIIAEENKLHEIIAGLTHTQEIKKELCKERIDYLKNLLEKQEKEIGFEKIEAFKEKVFTNYMKANVESLLAQEVGQVSAPFYIQAIMPLFLEYKPRILEKITILDDIQEKIASEIHKLLPEIKKDKKDDFISLLFNNYIHSNIKNQLELELGLFAPLFLNQIQTDLFSKKYEILNDLPINNINNEIAAHFEVHKKQIEETHAELKAHCKQLHDWLTEMNKQIKDEKQKSQDNKCRVEKLALLKQHKKFLLSNQSVEMLLTEESIAQQNDIKKFLKSLNHYDLMIEINEHLQLMKQSVNEDRQISQSLKKDKIAEMSIMQDKLNDQTMEPARRLAAVKEHGLNDRCKSVLFKDADSSFISLCKKLISSLLSIVPLISSYFKDKYPTPKNKFMFSMFTRKLETINQSQEEEPEVTHQISI